MTANRTANDTEPTLVGVFHFAGVDGVKFVRCHGVIYPLTPCCNASAKGSASGVVCRACYEVLPEGWGAGWTESEWTGRP